jgi:hypothetical protein
VNLCILCFDESGSVNTWLVELNANILLTQMAVTLMSCFLLSRKHRNVTRTCLFSTTVNGEIGRMSGLPCFCSSQLSKWIIASRYMLAIILKASRFCGLEFAYVRLLMSFDKSVEDLP